MGGKFHPKLNICERSIENKYCEGNVKRTLARELKVPEIVRVESSKCQFNCSFYSFVIVFFLPLQFCFLWFHAWQSGLQFFCIIDLIMISDMTLTRLETRTKESNMRASRRIKSVCEMRVMRQIWPGYFMA